MSSHHLTDGKNRSFQTEFLRRCEHDGNSPMTSSYIRWHFPMCAQFIDEKAWTTLDDKCLAWTQNTHTTNRATAKLTKSKLPRGSLTTRFIRLIRLRCHTLWINKGKSIYHLYWLVLFCLRQSSFHTTYFIRAKYMMTRRWRRRWGSWQNKSGRNHRNFKVLFLSWRACACVPPTMTATAAAEKQHQSVICLKVQT